MISLLMGGSAFAQAADAMRDRVELDEIVVTADRKNSFSADYVQAGAFRDARVIDTPLTVSVIPKELLTAQQALTVLDAVRNTAGVSQSQINSVIYSNLSIRGIPVDNTTNYRLNGVLPIINFIDMPMENKDRVEVLKGAAGLYYGFAAPSGIVNLVTSRPTEEPLTTVDFFANIHGGAGGHVDLSRVLGPIGVRFNAAAANLENGVKRSKGDRKFVSGALDWKPAEKLLIQLDAEYIDKSITEPTEIALNPPVNGASIIPPLQGASKNIGDSWLLADAWEYNLLARAKYNFSPAWSASFGAGTSKVDRTRRYSSFGSYNLITGNGVVGVGIFPHSVYEAFIYRADLAGAFLTGPIKHELLIGASDYTRDSTVAAAVRHSFPQNLYNPIRLPAQPTPPRTILNTSKVKDSGVYIFDRATYNKWLQLTLGYRKTEYSDEGMTSKYEASPSSLSYGVMVKPWKWMSVYGNYVEGLESGGIAQSIAKNAGELLPAAISEQKELGIKLEPRRGVLLTAAYFDISRASSYLNSSGFFVQDGEASYEGAEVSATGEVTRDLSISASAVFLEAVQATGAPSVVGKRLENVAKFSGSIFVEYRPPAFAGLGLSAGVFHVGRRAVNAANTGFVDGYTTLDLGASYETEIGENPVTIRVYGENVTGVKYWAASGSSLLAQGLPASVKFSISTSF
ncbi:TonB-dependent siderophore receptor [Phenylobacterium sp.]|uniref:TonB-dependent siderophore receptor n=1 Tax=Phenylobacterium sp. TaxID=1871053 RepID=UPI002FCBA505